MKEAKEKKKFGLFKKNGRKDTGSKKKGSKVEDKGSSVENVEAPSANPAEAVKAFWNGKEVGEMSEEEKKELAVAYINSKKDLTQAMAAAYIDEIGPHPIAGGDTIEGVETTAARGVQVRLRLAHEVVEEKNPKNTASTQTTWSNFITTVTAPQSEGLEPFQEKPQKSHTSAAAWTEEELVVEEEKTLLDDVEDPETLKQIAFLIAKERLLQIHADGLEISLREEREKARRGSGESSVQGINNILHRSNNTWPRNQPASTSPFYEGERHSDPDAARLFAQSESDSPSRKWNPSWLSQKAVREPESYFREGSGTPGPSASPSRYDWYTEERCFSPTSLDIPIVYRTHQEQLTTRTQPIPVTGRHFEERNAGPSRLGTTPQESIGDSPRPGMSPRQAAPIEQQRPIWPRAKTPIQPQQHSQQAFGSPSRQATAPYPRAQHHPGQTLQRAQTGTPWQSGESHSSLTRTEATILERRNPQQWPQDLHLREQVPPQLERRTSSSDSGSPTAPVSPGNISPLQRPQNMWPRANTTPQLERNPLNRSAGPTRSTGSLEQGILARSLTTDGRSERGIPMPARRPSNSSTDPSRNPLPMSPASPEFSNVDSIIDEEAGDVPVPLPLNIKKPEKAKDPRTPSLIKADERFLRVRDGRGRISFPKKPD